MKQYKKMLILLFEVGKSVENCKLYIFPQAFKNIHVYCSRLLGNFEKLNIADMLGWQIMCKKYCLKNCGMGIQPSGGCLFIIPRGLE